jgi:hypothetical protein
MLYRFGARFAFRGHLSAQLLFAGPQLFDCLFQRGDVARHGFEHLRGLTRKRGWSGWRLRRRRAGIRGRR